MYIYIYIYIYINSWRYVSYAVFRKPLDLTFNKVYMQRRIEDPFK